MTQKEVHAAPKIWSAQINAQPGRLSVLSLEANRGFEFAP
jgi:hypothetical protein